MATTSELSEMTTKNWDDYLREHGVRITPQRQMVIKAVADLEHATAEEILKEIQLVSSAVNLSTVYRALEVLEDIGLVAHAHLGHGAPTYFLVDDRTHIHLVCDICSQVTCTGANLANELGMRLDTEHGFDLDLTHLAIHGTCSKCRYMDTAAYI